MKIIKHSDLDFEANVRAVVGRADLDLVVHDATVREILKQIKERGDAALLDAGAGRDPIVGGVDQRLQLGVGENAFGDV